MKKLFLSLLSVIVIVSVAYTIVQASDSSTPTTERQTTQNIEATSNDGDFSKSDRPAPPNDGKFSKSDRPAPPDDGDFSKSNRPPKGDFKGGQRPNKKPDGKPGGDRVPSEFQQNESLTDPNN